MAAKNGWDRRGNVLVADGAEEAEVEGPGAHEVLGTLVRLEQEVAQAYQAALPGAEEVPPFQARLKDFAETHRGNVLALEALLRRRGGAAAVLRAGEVGGGAGMLLPRLSRMVAPFGPAGVLFLLLSHAQLLEGMYEVAREREWDGEAQGVLARLAGTAEEHLAWLTEVQEALEREDSPPVAQA
jgi:hypothetical protein